MAINSCIQSARNVTFVLQNNKKHIDNFDEWYKRWQSAMIKDPIMKWCVNARNFIVKQGDLETSSVAQVALLNSYNEASENIFLIDPNLSGLEIALIVKEKYIPSELSRYGYLSVERQWIAKGLEGIELLSALAHIFSVLKLLIADIDMAAGPEGNYRSALSKENGFFEALDFIGESDTPSSMLAFKGYRTTNYNLATGETATLSNQVVKLDRENIPKLKEKYGEIKSLFDGKGEIGTSLEDRVNHYLELAKEIIEVDGYLLTTVTIYDVNDKPYMVSTAFRNNEDKYLFWRDISKRVRKLRATMLITTGDVWSAKIDRANPLKLGENVADIPSKEEAVMASGTNRDGDTITSSAPYRRKNGAIIFGKEKIRDTHPAFMNSVLKSFKKLKRP